MVKTFDYNKTLKKAPKKFNFIRYIEKVQGRLYVSGTPVEWADGENTRFCWIYSTHELQVCAKKSRDAILLHYILTKKK